MAGVAARVSQREKHNELMAIKPGSDDGVKSRWLVVALPSGCLLPSFLAMFEEYKNVFKERK